ncbi:MAG: ribonuclease HI [Myxococcota bacterium]
MSLWIRARFRDDNVWARCSDTGKLVVERGLVPFRYNPHGKVYSTRAERLEVADDAKPEELEAVQARSGRGDERSGGRKAGKKGLASQARRARPETEAVQLWTDGACTGNPGPAGLGVVKRYRGEVEECSEYLGRGTNNIAELTAILRALEMVDDHALPVDVMTDSSYCVGLLTKGWRAKKNQALVAALRSAAERFEDLRIVKVPGHAGVPDNERADELAREAILRDG